MRPYVEAYLGNLVTVGISINLNYMETFWIEEITSMKLWKKWLKL